MTFLYYKTRVNRLFGFSESHDALSDWNILMYNRKFNQIKLRDFKNGEWRILWTSCVPKKWYIIPYVWKVPKLSQGSNKIAIKIRFKIRAKTKSIFSIDSSQGKTDSTRGCYPLDPATRGLPLDLRWFSGFASKYHCTSNKDKLKQVCTLNTKNLFNIYHVNIYSNKLVPLKLNKMVDTKLATILPNWSVILINLKQSHNKQQIDE